jgi:hypothetical protein
MTPPQKGWQSDLAAALWCERPAALLVTSSLRDRVATFEESLMGGREISAASRITAGIADIIMQ